MTNYEKIKSMSIEEFTEFIAECMSRCNNCSAFICLDGDCDCRGCKKDIKEWLEKEAD